MKIEDNKDCTVIKYNGKELVIMYSKTETLDGTLHTMYISNIKPTLHLTKRMPSDFVLDSEERGRMIEKLLKGFEQASREYFKENYKEFFNEK